MRNGFMIVLPLIAVVSLAALRAESAPTGWATLLPVTAAQAASKSEATKPESAKSDTEGDSTPQPQWTDFKAPAQGFSISFPVAPQVSEKPVKGETPLIQHDYQADPGDGTAYHAVVFEYPRGEGPIINMDYYDRLVDAYAKGSDSRVLTKGSATISGKHGYQAITLDRAGRVEHLIDIVPSGDRVYLLVSVGDRGHAKSEDAIRFRDSFELLKQADASNSIKADATAGAASGSASAGETPGDGAKSDAATTAESNASQPANP
jgi:hypothetical protein